MNQVETIKPAPNPKAIDRQVGGEHYTSMAIQPWDIIVAHRLDFFRGNALKYLLRAGKKGDDVEDLRKAAHYLEKAIELECADVLMSGQGMGGFNDT